MEIIRFAHACVSSAHPAPSTRPHLHQRHRLVDAHSAICAKPGAQRGRRDGENHHAAQSHERQRERPRDPRSEASCALGHRGTLHSQHDRQQTETVDPLAGFAVPPQNFLLAGGFSQSRPLANPRPHLSAAAPVRVFAHGQCRRPNTSTREQAGAADKA